MTFKKLSHIMKGCMRLGTDFNEFYLKTDKGEIIMSDIELIAILKNAGVHEATFIETKKIPFDSSLRQYCRPEMCQTYGRNWGCPPAAGEIIDLIEKAKSYKRALVYTTMWQLEDSFDVEGMTEGCINHKKVTNEITPLLRENLLGERIQLSAGGCTVCETCSKVEDKPCRYPELALHSVSAYGINVSMLAERCGIKYNNGESTLTMFGVLLFDKLSV